MTTEFTEADNYSIKKIIFNDPLGYAIVYYSPTGDNAVVLPQREERCDHERHQGLSRLEEVRDEEFYAEIEAMVRRRQREDASKEITKICEKVHELFREVEISARKDRELFNANVKKQIKGRSADEICDVIVNDVLNHTKPIRLPKADLDLRIKPLTRPVDATIPIRKAIPEVPVEREPKIFQKVQKMLAEDIQSNVHIRTYSRTLDAIQSDIAILKRRCTAKINFPH